MHAITLVDLCTMDALQGGARIRLRHNCTRHMKKILVVLGFLGFAFAGYTSASRLVLGRCAFNETCPYFLGTPACFYGFAMFALITLFAVLLASHAMQERTALLAILAVSGAGILFAGSFTFQELPALFRLGFRAYMLGLPTCMLGLLFYILVFCTALFCFVPKRKGQS